MKILFLTDTHFTGKAPSSRIDDIQETILNKLLDVKKIIEDEAIDIVLHGGDMFHTPDVSNQFTGKIANILKEYNAPMYVLPGNHDIYGYNTNTLGNTKLGLLEKTGVIKIIDRQSPIVLNDNGFKIGIEGQEYHGHIDEDMTEDFKIYNLNVDYNILLTHSMLLDHKFHESVKHTLIQDVITQADLVLAGHYHPGFKEKKIDDVWFFNPGGMLRVDASTEIVKSMPRIVVFDIQKDKFNYKYVELPSAKPGNEVFNTNNLTKKIYNSSLESFHEKLKKQKFKGVNILNLIDDYVKINNENVEAAEYAKDKISSISSLSCDNGFISEKNTIYITKVELYNFQSHTKKIVEFEKGLNVIVGESNAGKTAIIRSIYWCLYDKPNGSDFIKTGAKSCKVILHLSNGYKIERKRNRSTSGTYTLTSPDGTIEEFKGFSNSIPVEIANAHQMPPVKINGAEYRINVATQLEPAFLIGNSPNEKLSMLGALVDADRADVARREIGVEKKRASTEKKQLEQLREDKAKELEKYNHLDKLKSDIDILEIAIEKLEDDEVKLKNMIRIKDELIKYKNELIAIDNRLSNIVIPDSSDVQELKENLSKKIEYDTIRTEFLDSSSKMKLLTSRLNSIPDIEDLSESINEISTAMKSLEELTLLQDEYIKLYKELTGEKYKNIIDTSECNILIRELKKNLNKKYSAEMINESILELSGQVGELDKRQCFIENLIKQCNKDKSDKLESLKGVHQICEYCGSEIDINKALGECV